MKLEDSEKMHVLLYVIKQKKKKNILNVKNFMMFGTLQMWDSASLMCSAVPSACCKYLWLPSIELDPVADVQTMGLGGKNRL